MITRKTIVRMPILAKTQKSTKLKLSEAKLRRARDLRSEIKALRQQLAEALGFN